MKKVVLLGVLISIFTSISCDAGRLWKTINPSKLYSPTCQKDEKLTDNTYTAFRLNVNRLKHQVSNAPEVNLRNSKKIIKVPYPDGTLHAFRIVLSGSMSKELAAKYPNIRSYAGESVENTAVTARFDFNETGFHALIREVSDQIVIDPFCKASTKNYVCYFKSTYKSVRSQELR